MLDFFKVRLFANHRAIRPAHETLVAARSQAEARNAARIAAQALGCTYWTVEG